MSQRKLGNSFFSRITDRVRGLFGSKNKKTALAISQVLQAKQVSRIPRAEQIRQFPRLLSPGERRIAGLAGFIFVISTLALGWTLFNSQRVTVPVNGGSFTEGLIGSPQLINPLYASANDADSDLASLIFSGLVQLDENGDVVPDLASSYSISDDGKEYVFVLRDDATWHDGEPVRVADIIFTYTAIQNSAYRSPLRAAFLDTSITQVDERTVKFTLSEPFTPFLTLLTTGILPSHAWADIQPINATAAEINRTPIGSGPYRLKSVTRDNRGNVRSYTLTSYAGYYGQRPFIQEIDFKFYSDVNAALDALKNRNIDSLAYIPPVYVDEVDNLNLTSIQTPSLQQYTALFFNQDAQPLFKNSNLREAIHLAVDRQLLVDTALSGLGRPILDPVLPGVPGFQEAEFPITDLDTANQLLDELEWTYPEAGGPFRQSGDDELRIVLATIDTPELIQVAEELQRQLAQIGINLVINPVSSLTFQTEVLPSRDFELLLTGTLLGVTPDLYSYWHSSQSEEPGLNLAQFINRDVDEAIDLTRTSTDETVRAESYAEIANVLREDLPAVFLYQSMYPYALSSKVKGFSLDRIALPEQRFEQIESWYIRTRRIFKAE